MITIKDERISKWAAWWSDDNPESAISEYASFKISMTADEKEQVDQYIAVAQIADDPDTDSTDAGLVARCLIDNGFHPAFEYEAVVSGQQAFERLKSEQSDSFKP